MESIIEKHRENFKDINCTHQQSWPKIKQSVPSPSPPAQVMPPFLHAIRTCNKDMREYMFQQLGQIISIIKQHARDYMQDVFSVIRVRGEG